MPGQDTWARLRENQRAVQGDTEGTAEKGGGTGGSRHPGGSRRLARAFRWPPGWRLVSSGERARAGACGDST